jgi:hypothetical protein
MKLPGFRGSDRAQTDHEETPDSRSAVEDSMPPLTRHELLSRLGMDDDPEIVGMPTLLMADAESAAA